MKYFTTRTDYPDILREWEFFRWNSLWEYVPSTLLEAFFIPIERNWILKAYLLHEPYETPNIYSISISNWTQETNLSYLAFLVHIPRTREEFSVFDVHAENGKCKDRTLGLDLSVVDTECCRFLIKRLTQSSKPPYRCNKYNADLPELDQLDLCKKEQASKGLTRERYMYFWFDPDVSDCSIGRFITDESREQVIAEFDRVVKERDELKYIELSLDQLR